MGLCCSGIQTPPPVEQILQVVDAKTGTHLAIENKLERARCDKTIKKLLLLGIGNCGKSTVYKHLNFVLKQVEDEYVFEEIQQTIRKNCVLGMMKLLKATIKNHDANRNHYEANMYNKCMSSLILDVTSVLRSMYTLQVI